MIALQVPVGDEYAGERSNSRRPSGNVARATGAS